MNDIVFLGAVAGVAAQAVKLILGYVAVVSGWALYTDFHVASGLFIAPALVKSPIGIFIGVVATIYAAGFLGVLLAVFLRTTGCTYWWLKGYGFGAITCLLPHAVVRMGASAVIPTDVGSAVASLLLNPIWGLVAAALITAKQRRCS